MHMHRLVVHLPHVNNNIPSLRTFYDPIENYVRGLSALIGIAN